MGQNNDSDCAFSEVSLMATDLVGNEVWFEGAPVVRGDFPGEGG